ncbi:MAG: PD-(D/E)XK nuclease family protein, partial [Candidatus Eisenbacteria bacterium]|nr:PD-(D/E)XK nuclease family protein [Candidatus Eisenbacteria bacterium]
MNHRVVLAPSFPALLERLTYAVCRHHADDPLAAEVVLVPNAPVARFVESSLAAAASGPLLNVQVVPMRWATQRLAPRDAHVPEPATPLVLEAAARSLLRRYLPEMVQLAGAERVLAATFNDLLQAGFVDPEVTGEFAASLPGENLDRQTLELYARWLSLLKERGISPVQIILSESAWTIDARWMHVYGFPMLEGVYADMIERWARGSPDLQVFHYYPCHPDALQGKRFGYEYVAQYVEQRHMHRVAERIKAPGYSSAVFPEMDALLAREAPGVAYATDLRLDHVGFIAAAGEAGEVEAAARLAASTLTRPRHAARAERLAVVAPDISVYEPFIRSCFSEMDLPVHWLHPVSAGQHPAVRWMSTALGLRERGFSAATTRELLASPFVRFPGPWDSGALPVLDAKLGEMGATSLAGGAWCGRWCDEADAPWAALVAAFIGELEATLDAESAGLFVDSMREFLRRWVLPTITEEPGILAPWVRSIECLRDLDDLGFLDGEPPGEVVCALCLDALDGISLPAGPPARGVVVGSMAAASGMSFDAVIILGANRGRLPRPAREDPLLSDATRSRIVADLGYGVPLASDAPRRDKLLFVLTILSARERAWVTYQHADAEGDAKSPSLFLPLIFGEHADRVVRRHTDRSSRLDELATEGERHFTAREAVRLALAESDPGRAGTLAPLLGECFTPGLDRARSAVRAREGAEATVFDVRASAPPNAVLRALGRSGGWRDLDTCPFRFFLGQILSIPEAAAAVGLWQPTLLDRGNLVHKALEEALRPGIPAEPDCRGRAREAWEAARTWYLSEHRHADLPGFVALELDHVAAWFLPLLEAEIRLVSQRSREVGQGFWVSTERRYDGVLTLDGERIPLRVRFDRLESRRAAEKSIPLRIVDYKLRTAERSASRDMRDLQAFLYAEAIESAQGIRPDAEYVEIVPEPPSVQTLSLRVADGVHGAV